jgi:hypothetical protein
VSTTFLRAFPWALEVVEAVSLYGDRTPYPVRTGLVLTHDLYWRSKRLIITGGITVSNDADSTGIELAGVGEDRGEKPEDLIEPVGGFVPATGFDNSGLEIAIGTVDFNFFAVTRALVHDYREQYLNQMISGGLSTVGTPDPEFDPNVSFSSTESGTEVGRCTCVFGEAYDFPIFANVSAGYTVEANFTITRVKWED